MGRYEFLLKKPIRVVARPSLNWGKGLVVREKEKPAEFLKRNLLGKPLTANEINDNLKTYYAQFAEKDRLSFNITIASEEEQILIEPGDDYTGKVMQEVRHSFKNIEMG